MLDPYNEMNNNLDYWTIESFSNNGLVIQLVFNRPLEVSQDFKPDQLVFHIRMGQWKTLDGKSPPDLVLNTKDIARQVSSKDEAEKIQSAATASSRSSAFTSIFSTIAMQITGASLNYLWDALNAL